MRNQKSKIKAKDLQRRKRPVQYQRRTFMLDKETEQELEAIQIATRASTVSATVRYVVRKMAHLMRQCGEEAAVVQIVLPQSEKRSRRSFVEVDLPPLRRD